MLGEPIITIALKGQKKQCVSPVDTVFAEWFLQGGMRGPKSR